MGFPLSEEQRQVVDDRGGELLVSAAAGSGKTRVLVERLLDRISNEGLDLTDFLVITYTKAAAAELRDRIAQELSKRLALEPGNRHLRRQSALVYRASISTIHSFCSRLLRENGHLLDLNPDFRLCDQGEDRILMDRVLTDVMDRQYEDLDPESDFVHLVDTLSAGRDDVPLEKIVRNVFIHIQSHQDPERWLREQSRQWELKGTQRVEDTAWGTLLLAQSRRQVRFCLDRLLEAKALADRDEMLSINYGNSLAASVAGTRLLLDGLDQGWDAARMALPVPFPTAGKKKGILDLEAQERMKAIRKRCKTQLDSLAELFTEDSAALLEGLEEARPAVQGLMALVEEFSRAYRAEKDRRGLMDFSDLEHFAAKLLQKDGEPTQLAQSWSERLAEVMVDEYQDTNQVQNAIFTAVSQQGRKLFLVGDVKQSIYRFRLADPTIFLEKYRSFFQPEQAGEGEPRKRVLSRNFRSRPEVLEAVNDLFRSIMSRQLGELDYTQDQALYPGQQEYPGETQPVELAVLDMAFLGELEEEEKEHKDFLEARYAAQRIEELMDRYTPGDIMLLLRSPSGSIRHYIRALEERNIPWSAEGTGDFFLTTEVQVAMSILKIVDNPRQDVALLAALRSPVYGFTADRLAILRSQEKGDFYSVLVRNAQAGEADCVSFLRELEDLRFQSGDRSARELIWHIYEKTNLLGLFGSMDGGEIRQSNLLSLYALAGRLEAGGCRSLFQFLTRVERMRATKTKMNLPGEDKRLGGVSILTIHRSKGLEKPVVLVCGLSKQFNRDDLRQRVLFHPVLGVGPIGLDRKRMVEYPTLARRAVAVQAEREMLSEEMRLLYVAMTRAKEKLILTAALRNAPKNLAKLGENAAVPLAPMALEAQASLGSWVLLHALTRPEGDKLREAAGLGRVFSTQELGMPWDIRIVPGETLLEVEPRAAAESAGPLETAQEEDLFPLLSWRYPHPEACTAPSKRTATQLKGRELDQEAAEETAMSRKDKPLTRPDFAAQEQGLTAAQRGTAIHLAMQYLPLDGDGSVRWVSGELERLTQKGFLTPLQGRAVDPALLSAFVTSPLGREMAGAKLLRREFKFSLLVPQDGEEVLFQGVVDAWFGDEEGITVLDFKSDRVSQENAAGKAEEYRPQLEAYAQALERILGLPVKRRVIWFFYRKEAVEL